MAQSVCSCGWTGRSADRVVVCERSSVTSAHRLLVTALRPACLAASNSPSPSHSRGQARQTGLHARQRRSVLVRATEEKSTTRELPIFPLDTVAFPSAPVPLHIFEARYRVLFNTLLAGSEGLEEGLIQYDKPFCGSRQFGMCWMNPSDGGLAAIGTLLRIERHARLPDGRLAVDNLGVQRFRVLKVLEQKPVLMCEVELLQDDDDSDEEVKALAAEVAGAFRDLLRLNHRMNRAMPPARECGAQGDDDSTVVGELEAMRPRDLSFWIASVFADNTRHQQSLLQEDSTLERLKQEQHVLSGTVSYLRAKLALEGAFTSSSESSGSGDSGGSEGA